MTGIDKNVRRLVKILNKYPGVRTSSSCGGHNNPTEHQLPENEWSVGIDIFGKNIEADMPCYEGWGSLGKISHATMEYILEDEKDIEGSDIDIIIVFCNLSDREIDPDGRCNYFEIRGHNADINIFCDILEREL